MLIALLTGQRCQMIHQLDLSFMQTLPDKYIFVIGTKLRHTRPGKHQEPTELHRYPDKDLCVIEHIREHIHHAKDIRQQNTKLLIRYIKPHKPVLKDTIARWVKDKLQRAGIQCRYNNMFSS